MTTRYEDQIQLNTIAYSAFKSALIDGLNQGIDRSLPRDQFIAECGLKGDDPLLMIAYDVIVLGNKE